MPYKYNSNWKNYWPPARILVAFTFFINGCMYATWASRVPRIQEYYHIDYSTMGLILLCASTGSLIAMPFAGWIIATLSSRKVTILATVASLFTTAGWTFTEGSIALGIGFFLMGMSNGAMDVAMNAQAVYVEKLKNKPIMSNFHAIFSLGMMVGAAWGSFTAYLNWSLMLQINSIAIILLSIFIIYRKHFVDDKKNTQEHTSSKAFTLPDKRIVIIGIIAFCCMLGEGSMSDWAASYLKDILGARPTIASIGLFAFATAMMLGRFVGDKARLRFGDKKLIRYGAIIATSGILIVLLSPGVLAALIGFVTVGLGLSVIVPIAFSLAGNLKDVPTGTGIGMVTTIGYAGFLVGPTVLGFLADAYTLRASFIFVFALFIMMFLLARKYTF